jgi:sodium/potassium-transporting ATPase subunit alpha
LTGETEYVEATAQKYNIDNKTAYFEASNMAFTNCLVVFGEGIGLVVTLSSKSHLGLISHKRLKLVKQKKSGVVQELSKYIFIIFIISLIGVLVYVVVFFVYLRSRYNPSAANTANDIISIVISGIPFGMPISVTIGLFLVSRRLKRGKILVKNVFAVDSLSSVDVIITDKTGTITRNELVVSNVMQATKEIDPELCTFDKDFVEQVIVCHFIIL